MKTRQSNFAEASSAAILISLVVLSLIANVFFKQEASTTGRVEIRFPAYETESEAVNKAMPFVMNITMPEGWEVKTEGSMESYPEINAYNPYFLYMDDEQIGNISFNVFTPPAEEVENVKYHQYVWPVIDSAIYNNTGKFEISTYMIVRLTDKFEAGYCKLSDGEKTAEAILCYNKDLKNMAVITLDEGLMSEEDLQQLCLSLSFTAM